MNRTSYKGFTLIEVLVALIILAIALTAVMKATQDSIQGVTRVQNHLIAHLIAMNVIAKMQTGLLAKPLSGSPKKGTTRMLQQNWRWQAGTAPIGNHFYERIYVDVYRRDGRVRIEHVVAFLRIAYDNKNSNI